MSRRTIALVVAIILAAVAAIALIAYVQGKADEAIEEGTPVIVYVAKEDIPAGKGGDAVITEGLVDQTEAPLRLVVPGAITSLDQISGRVASVTIFAGEQITSSRFVAPGQVQEGGIKAELERNQVALSLDIGLVPGVAGFVQVGDRVSIMAQLSAAQAGTTQQRVEFLLQNVEVIQIGQRAIAEDGTPTTVNPSGQIVFTVALTPRDAERLVFAKLQGTLYFVLLPEGARPTNTPGRTATNIF
jgi:pilus assembly protein CpaB